MSVNIVSTTAEEVTKIMKEYYKGFYKLNETLLHKIYRADTPQEFYKVLTEATQNTDKIHFLNLLTYSERINALRPNKADWVAHFTAQYSGHKLRKVFSDFLKKLDNSSLPRSNEQTSR
ncbi:hypothetical protein RhiirA5_376487 [Rhizophagus irregularis]|uniref:Uncharacterized protein n=1 Tax=Rhizophagus irregularis TaxID=588596 RepID=A0A2N0PMU5_9GLOM|nr:hypothetical protein RhiirA5_376487 [Rhizophagus irregularis]